ncbi:MAG: DUF924 domain-containing protein [Rhodobacteraceae bacterium]|nr:DUF924 domain-containing protein [Paracoccaceae bacterium]
MHGEIAQNIVTFWTCEVGAEGWYKASDDLDNNIRAKFLDTWEMARSGAYKEWYACPEKSLALIILLDQFPRNMFRGQARAFATDRKAVEAAVRAIESGWDMRTPEPSRQFFYLPLMHSENLTHQERCVRLIKTRLPKTGAESLLHARAHRMVIRLYGRFPFRNAALGRQTTEAEQRFIDQGGYGLIAEGMRTAA